MKLKRLFFLAVGCALAWPFTARAVDTVVYVSESAVDLTYTQATDDVYAGQTGASIGTAFGSLTAAYHYLFLQSGNHTIYLHGDGDGTFKGIELGADRNNNTFGTMEFNNGTGFPGPPLGSPSWTTVTLKPSPTSPNPITLSVTAADITGKTEGAHSTYPAAYEKEVTNPGNNSDNLRLPENRGQVIRGLWNPGASMSMTGMIVEDMTIILGGGHVLVGNAFTASGKQQFTFNNVDLYLQTDVIDNNPINGLLTGDPWGKSALFASNIPQADLDNCSLDFNNSTIYLKPDDNSAWSGNFYVGQTWSSSPANSLIYFKLPNDFVDGNRTSYLRYWDGSKYVDWAELSGPSCGIWQSGRNAGNTLTAYLNGAGLNNTFMVNFNNPLPPTGPIMLVR